MSLAAGEATTGKTGSLAAKSLATGGVQRNLATAAFNPGIMRGDELLRLMNNSGYSANKAEGVTVGRFDFAMPLNPIMTPADFFARALGSVSGDTDAINYHTLTRWTDNLGSAPEVYGLCKYAGMRGSVQFGTNGLANAIGIQMFGMCVDPESGSVTNLTAPSAGAIAPGKVKTYANTSYTGASHVVLVQWDIATNLVISPGVQAGTNSKYPWLVKGLLMTDLTGTATVHQYKNATTVLGADGSDGTLVLNMGTTGSGLAQTMQLMPVSIAKPSSLGINFQQSTYAFKSVDGSVSPVSWADL